MRDHPCASYHPIQGQLWGGRVKLQGLKSSILTMPVDSYMDDIHFLTREVWPLVRQDVLQHDSFSCGRWGARPFPTQRDAFDPAVLNPDTIYMHSRPLFVGQTFLANNSRPSRETFTFWQATQSLPKDGCEALTFVC